jgi:pimeloyl-ACP methyl ester carboxylesterase
MNRYKSAPPVRETPPTLLIGPAGISGDAWRFSRIDGIPFEYPGHGSRPRQAGWTYSSLAQEIADQFDGPLDVLGISTGGLVVAKLLLDHADHIRSAVVMCSNLGGKAHNRADAPCGSTPDTDAQLLALWFSPFARRLDFPGVNFARRSALELDPHACEDARRAIAEITDPTPEALEAVSTPVTIVGGTFDRVVGIEPSQRLHSLIRNSRHEVMPVSHMVHLEQPEIVNTVLDRHRIWAPVGNRVEHPLGSGVWLEETDMMEGYGQ